LYSTWNCGWAIVHRGARAPCSLARQPYLQCKPAIETSVPPLRARQLTWGHFGVSFCPVLGRTQPQPRNFTRAASRRRWASCLNHFSSLRARKSEVLFIFIYTHPIYCRYYWKARATTLVFFGMVVPRWPASPTLEAQRPTLSRQPTSAVLLSRIDFRFQGGECSPADYDYVRKT
jgi:hypothetical protein